MRAACLLSVNTECAHAWGCLPSDGRLPSAGPVIQTACCPCAHVQQAQKLEAGSHWSTYCSTMSSLPASHRVKLAAAGQVI